MARRSFVALALMLFFVPALPLSAADVEVGLRHLVVLLPETSFAGGTLELPLSRGFAATAEVFLSDAWAVHASAGFVNPEAILYPAGGDPPDVDLGTLGLDMWAVMARRHVAPRARLSGFVSGGVAYVQIGNLDDQFGDDVHAAFDPAFAARVETGLRYRLLENIHLELAASWMPLDAETSRIRADDPRVSLPASVELDPLTISGGVSWRFR